MVGGEECGADRDGRPRSGLGTEGRQDDAPKRELLDDGATRPDENDREQDSSAADTEHRRDVGREW